MFHQVVIVVIAIIGPALTTTTIGDPVAEKLQRNFVDKHQINYERNLLLWLRSNVEEKQFEGESQEERRQMNNNNNNTTNNNNINNNNNSYNSQKTFERRKIIGKSSFNTKITDKFHDFIKVHLN